MGAGIGGGAAAPSGAMNGNMKQKAVVKALRTPKKKPAPRYG
tara:strand:- start:291 stop:416 length:126 start_codon:yes stop_codon:yes gene_type:complete